MGIVFYTHGDVFESVPGGDDVKGDAVIVTRQGHSPSQESDQHHVGKTGHEINHLWNKTAATLTHRERGQGGRERGGGE